MMAPQSSTDAAQPATIPMTMPTFSAVLSELILEGSVLTGFSEGGSVDDAPLELSPLGVCEVVGGVGDSDLFRALSRSRFRNWSVNEVIGDYRG